MNWLTGNSKKDIPLWNMRKIRHSCFRVLENMEYIGFWRHDLEITCKERITGMQFISIFPYNNDTFCNYIIRLEVADVFVAASKSRNFHAEVMDAFGIKFPRTKINHLNLLRELRNWGTALIYHFHSFRSVNSFSSGVVSRWRRRRVFLVCWCVFEIIDHPPVDSFVKRASLESGPMKSAVY